MTTELSTTELGAISESVLLGGDLSKLSPTQRVSYYMQVCKSLQLNPLTKPFDYINLNGRLVLYARKDATDQLRDIHEISIDDPKIEYVDEWIIVSVMARDGKGRQDWDIGAVSKSDMRGNFGNALMKAVTKAKRRVTLSICGLGMLDETEVETIPGAKPVEVTETGEILEAQLAEQKSDNGNLPSMNYETAYEVMNSAGTKYGDLPTDKLSHMYNAIMTRIKNNSLDADELEKLQYKASAIQTIMTHRAGQMSLPTGGE